MRTTPPRFEAALREQPGVDDVHTHIEGGWSNPSQPGPARMARAARAAAPAHHTHVVERTGEPPRELRLLHAAGSLVVFVSSRGAGGHDDTAGRPRAGRPAGRRTSAAASRTCRRSSSTPSPCSSRASPAQTRMSSWHASSTAARPTSASTRTPAHVVRTHASRLAQVRGHRQRRPRGHRRASTRPRPSRPRPQRQHAVRLLPRGLGMHTQPGSQRDPDQRPLNFIADSDDGPDSISRPSTSPDTAIAGSASAEHARGRFPARRDQPPTPTA